VTLTDDLNDNHMTLIDDLNENLATSFPYDVHANPVTLTDDLPVLVMLSRLPNVRDIL